MAIKRAGLKTMILSNILQKDIVQFLQGQIQHFEGLQTYTEFAGSANPAFYRTLITVYGNALHYLQRSTITVEALKKRLVELRKTPQEGLPFVADGLAAQAAIEDVINFIETKRSLIPREPAQIPVFFRDFKAKLDKDRLELVRKEQRLRIEREQREQAESDLKAKNERLLDVGLDPKKVRPFLATEPKQEAGQPE